MNPVDISMMSEASSYADTYLPPLLPRQHIFDRPSGRNLGVELLEDCPGYPLQVVPLPIDFESPGDGIHKALISFKDFQWSGDSSRGKEGRMSHAKSRVRIRESLPVG
jgi:hypothetical protein